MQENLRQQTKVLKALYGDIFTYKEIANYLEMNINSFYNWLNGAYDLGDKKAKKLQEILNDIFDTT